MAGFSSALHLCKLLTKIWYLKIYREVPFMSRKKKLVNNTTIPQYAIERFARCVVDDIRADYAKPEVQADFQRWLAEREVNKKTRVAKTATLVSFGPSLELGYSIMFVCIYSVAT